MKKYGEMTAAERAEFEMDWMITMLNMISMPNNNLFSKSDKTSILVLLLKTRDRPLANCLVEFEAGREAFIDDAIARAVSFIENQIEMNRTSSMPFPDLAGPAMLKIMSDPSFRALMERRADQCLRLEE